jgi:hypothetical protein
VLLTIRFIVIIGVAFYKSTFVTHAEEDNSDVEVHFFLAVLAASLKSLAEGAPLEPTFRIFSPEPALIRAFLAAMLAYKPGLVATL